MNKIRKFPLQILILSLLILSACASPTQELPTIVPTIQAEATQAPTQPAQATNTPVSPAVEGYPAPGEGEIPPTSAYPEPGNAPARPNLSRVTAQLIEMAASEDPAVTRLRVLVVAAEPADERGDFVSALVNQEADFYVQGLEIPDLQPGEPFRAEVTYNGDEFGGNFFITMFLK